MTEYASRHWIPGDRPLRRDIRLLGWQLRRLVIDHGGERLWHEVTKMRDLARLRERGEADAEAELVRRVRAMDTREIAELVRALGLFFDLSNVAEDRHRVRVLRDRQARGQQRETFCDAADELAATRLHRRDLRELIEHLDVELVLTAHPTEAKRRTVRRVLRKLHRDLEKLDRNDLQRPRRARVLERMRRDLVGLWYADSLRPRRPTVLEELDRSLFAVRTLWRVLPHVFRQFNDAFAEAGYDPVQVAGSLRFGNWVGGDRDGNPFVTAETTAETLRRLRRSAVQLHLRECRRLEDRLVFSRVRLPVDNALSDELAEAGRRWPALAARFEQMHPDELYRQWLAMIEHRLRRTLGNNGRGAGCDHDHGDDDAIYHTGRQLADDLARVEKSLRDNDLHEIADAELRDWQQRVATFGLHLMRTDIRENSNNLRQVVSELMGRFGRCGDWSRTTEYQRQELLTERLAPVGPELLDAPDLSPLARDMLMLFRMLQTHAGEHGVCGLGGLIVSMTHQPSDALCMMWLNRLGARLAGRDDSGAILPVVPLFETYDDLDRAGYMLASLLDIPDYRAYVRAGGNHQICMVGYSDSTKDAGYLAANWALYRGQAHLAEVAVRYGVELVVFHGRGGALGRGGGPAADAIRALPAEAVRGHFRMTEQGEVIAERFDVPTLALRHLEQVLWATLTVSGIPQPAPRYEWLELFERLSQRGRQAYADLVSNDGFIEYFYSTTPITVIESLPISSRPSRRSGQASIDDLRAIPYTFAWTQARQLVTGFYGLGTAYASLTAREQSVLAEMYREWPFFAAVIDNAELAVSKCDPSIARHYAAAADSPRVMSIWKQYASEHGASVAAVLAITGQKRLLEHIPWLDRSLKVRDPYIDALNLVQVELMRRRAAAEAQDDAGPDASVLQQGLRMSIQAIASGLRNTG